VALCWASCGWGYAEHHTSAGIAQHRSKDQ